MVVIDVVKAIKGIMLLILLFSHIYCPEVYINGFFWRGVNIYNIPYTRRRVKRTAAVCAL